MDSTAKLGCVGFDLFPPSGTELRGQTLQGLLDNEWAAVWIEMVNTLDCSQH